MQFTRRLSGMLFWSVVLMGMSAELFAATIRVPQDQPTIQSGINAAVNGDTVLVSPGVYNENIKVFNKRVFVIASGGAKVTNWKWNQNDFGILVDSGGRLWFQGFRAIDFPRISSEPDKPQIRALSGSLHLYNNVFIGDGTVTNQRYFLFTNFADTVVLRRNQFHGLLLSRQSDGASVIIAGNSTQWVSVVNNVFDSTYRALVTYVDGGGEVKNNIFTNSLDYPFYAGSDPVIETYNCFWQNFAIIHQVSSTSIQLNPLYNSPTNADFRITQGSPCINTGDPNPIYNDPDGSRNDIGAIPYVSTRAPKKISVPSEYATIIQAVDSSVSGDTISISAGIYSEVGIQITKDLLIEGSDNWGTILRPPNGQLFLIQSADVIFKSLVMDGTAQTSTWPTCDVNRAISCENATLEMDSCKIFGFATHAYGAALFTNNTRCKINNSEISRNRSEVFIDRQGRGCGGDARGAAIYHSGKSLTIYSSSLDSNYCSEFGNFSGARGGAIHFVGDSLRIIASNFVGNSTYNAVSSQGAALYVQSTATVITNSVFRECSANGGGFYPGSSEVGCRGGAIFFKSGQCSVDSSIFEDCEVNSSPVGNPSIYPIAGGGAIYCESAILHISDSRLVRSSANITSAWSWFYSEAVGGAIYSLMPVNCKGVAFVESSVKIVSYDIEPLLSPSVVRIGVADIFCEAGLELRDCLSYFASVTYPPLLDTSEYFLIEKLSNVIEASVVNYECGLVYPYPDSMFGNVNFDSTTFANPLYCDTSSGFELVRSSSPCLPSNNSCGVAIGHTLLGCQNASPTLQSSFLDSATEAIHFQFLAISTDPDGPSISYSFINLPSWLSSNADSVYGTPTLNNDDTSFTVIASDGFLADTQVVTLVVLRTTPGADSLHTSEEFTNIHVLDHTPQFDWDFLRYDGNAAQTQFEIAVGTDNNWAFAEKWNPAPFTSSDTFVVYDGSTLVDGATYYVRLRVNNGIAWSPWFESSFRMNSVPSVPLLASPSNGSITSNPPSLAINNSSDAENDPLVYDFAIFTDSALTNQIDAASGISQTPTTTQWTPATLAENTRFYWRSRSYDGFEYSNWSSARSFVTNGVPESPSAFALITPNNSGLPDFDLTPTLNWQPALDPDPNDTVRYLLEVSITPTFTFDFDIDSIGTNNFTLVDSLLFGTHYWWRVTARDKTGLVTSSSNVLDFWTWALGDVDHSHTVDIGDLTMLVDHLFISFDPILPRKVADMNGDCSVDIGDLTALVDHLFISFADLTPGCE